MIDQFDRLKKRNAFLEQYKKEKMFENGLGEFDDAKATAEELLKEYKACESADYITYVSRLPHDLNPVRANNSSRSRCFHPQGSSEADQAH